MTDDSRPLRLGRRAFLEHGTLVLTAASLGSSESLGADQTPPLRIGLVTDLHYADKGPVGTRHYRETLVKLGAAGERFAQEKPSFLVELGDLIDSADSADREREHLRTINRAFSAISADRHYVLGNHCVDGLTKEEFLGGVERDKSYYSFDRGGCHFVVLDACFRSDGRPYGRKNFEWTDANIPPAELDWLAADLRSADKPTIVFAHQRLDVSDSYGVKNNAAVRRVLEESGKVAAVFQGHSHRNDLREIGGVHYCTLVAMVEGSGVDNNGYSVLELDPNGTIRLRGFGRQKSFERERVRGA